MIEIRQLSSKYTHLMVATAITESPQKTTTSLLDTINNTNGNQCCTSISEGCCRQSTESCTINGRDNSNQVNVTINEENKTNNFQHTAHLTGRQLDLPPGLTLNDCRIFYIGKESRTLTNLLMTHNKTQVND
jgi:hypothetical protein